MSIIVLRVASLCILYRAKSLFMAFLQCIHAHACCGVAPVVVSSVSPVKYYSNQVILDTTFDDLW
jgi:hypothetical protein